MRQTPSNLDNSSRPWIKEGRDVAQSRRKQKNPDSNIWDCLETLFKPAVVKGHLGDNQRNLYMGWVLDSINTLWLMLLGVLKV